MISVVIPTLDAADRLPLCLQAFIGPSIAGLVREVVISDGGSTDGTLEIAEAAGAAIISGEPGRGRQLRRGAEAAAKGSWLLFLHADTVLDETWAEEASQATAACGKKQKDAVFAFTLRFDAAGVAPALVAAGAMLRTRLLASPYGDQGLLVSRSLYDDVGGFRDLPLFEDVDLIDRIVRRHGRGALQILRSKATTSASRYLRDGYARRVLKNFACLWMHRAGIAPEKIAAFYRS